MHEGELRLTRSERTELRDRMRSRTLPAEDVRRARLIVLLAQGKSYMAIRQVLGCILRGSSREETARFNRLAHLNRNRIRVGSHSHAAQPVHPGGKETSA